jgi:hypothetical protein
VGLGLDWRSDIHFHCCNSLGVAYADRIGLRSVSRRGVLSRLGGEATMKDDGRLLYAICDTLLWIPALLTWLAVISIPVLAIWKIVDLATYFALECGR